MRYRMRFDPPSGPGKTYTAASMASLGFELENAVVPFIGPLYDKGPPLMIEILALPDKADSAGPPPPTVEGDAKP
jgi:hypothetical protein